MPRFYSYEVSKVIKLTETKGRMVVARDWDGGQWGAVAQWV